MSAGTAEVTPERIMQFAWGYVPPLVLEAAIRHRVFDVLDAAPKTLEDTAVATGSSERGLRAIMNVLVGLNFLAKDGQKYSLTPESEAFLVSTKPAFQGGFLKHASKQLIPNWLHLNDVVDSGKPVKAVNQEGAGSEFFQQFVVDIFPMSYPAATVLAMECLPDCLLMISSWVLLPAIVRAMRRAGRSGATTVTVRPAPRST